MTSVMCHAINYVKQSQKGGDKAVYDHREQGAEDLTKTLA